MKRELKSLYFGNYNSDLVKLTNHVSLLRLVIHKNQLPSSGAVVFEDDQIDESNVFNQTSLLAVNCLGKPIVRSLFLNVRTPLGDGGPTWSEGARFEDQLVYDKLVISKLDYLKRIKEQAVEGMQFERAKKAQDAINIVQKVG